VPEGYLVAYGHAGDGNLHFNINQRVGTDRAAFLSREAPLKRAIQSELENPLAKAILEGRFAPKDVIRADWRGGRMTFDKAPARAAA